MGKSTSQYVILVILAVAGIAGYLYYTKYLSSKSSSSATSPPSAQPTGGSSGGSPTGPSPAPPAGAGGTGTAGGSSGDGSGSTQFPVTTSSSASDIVAAFQQSGYFSQLSAEGLGSDISQATNSPSAWLSEHPYLYTYYPNYFAN